MNVELHPAEERGHVNHGWLDTFHNFSFAGYFNPVREHFGCLRVLNDDTITGGSGFEEHGHKNMEIITIPLIGRLEHKDSMGHSEVLSPGDVQVMTAGSGIRHSEFNHSKTEICNFLQIWIYTREKELPPRYDQRSFGSLSWKNRLKLLVMPDKERKEDALFIHQDAWISRITIDSDTHFTYSLYESNHKVFVFLIEGKIEIAGNQALSRDAFGISKTTDFKIDIKQNADILFIEVPFS